MIPRSCGLLLHVTSLPSGRLGRDAFRFVDFCAAAGQRWWQMLPVHPPGFGGSPYSALSALAGDEALLDPKAPSPPRPPDIPGWLTEYALFRALKESQGGRPWTQWPAALRDRRPRALARARAGLAGEIARHVAFQLAFDAQWRALRAYAHGRGVGLIGDMPIFVAHDSADVWTNRDLFKLDRTGRPTVVTGVPPDYFSAEGQRWGNPHYRWDVLRRRKYRWWVERVDRMFALFDVVRIDHFLGFVRAWEVPAKAATAREGRYVGGPGGRLFAALGPRGFVAEDLGLLTAEAARLRDDLGLPGMRVLHFGFGADASQRPFSIPRNCAVYTGTHDNNTTVGWYREGGEDRQRALDYAGTPASRIHWGLTRVAYLSPADLAIVPVQDVLGLDGTARMNRPGATGGNWGWRLRRGQLTKRHAFRLRALKDLAGR